MKKGEHLQVIDADLALIVTLLLILEVLREEKLAELAIGIV